ncbi:hypothetical protein CRM22_003853 [Opisthorchis felineus]|uniref:Uncharacterized protein n=1 Tax=Opisthorchis felineus TaxID=147828 RepID=A0A4S2M4B9_OPIFE|nr:hypothetical protein CRM22_003853 [Opisthorchis felineus]
MKSKGVSLKQHGKEDLIGIKKHDKKKKRFVLQSETSKTVKRTNFFLQSDLVNVCWYSVLKTNLLRLAVDSNVIS